MKRWMLVIIFVAAVCFGQSQFTVLAGGTGRDEANSMTLTSDGGYALTGRTFSFGAGYTDIIVAKFTSDGVVSWAKAYGGEYYDVGNSIIETTDGGLLIAGNSENFGMPYNGMFLMKLSSAGAMEWAKGVQASYYEYGYSALQTTDGGYVIAGQTGSHGAGGDDFYLVKFTSAGDLVWAKAFGASEDDFLTKAIATSDGGIAIVGYTDSYGTTGNGIIVAKLTPTYSIAWAKVLSSPGRDFGSNIVQTSDGGYAISGYTDGYGAGSNEILIAKLSPSGDLEWASSLGGTEGDYGNDVYQSSDGALLIVGTTESFGSGEDDVLLARFSSTGAFEWANVAGGYNDDSGISIEGTSDGGSAVGGYSDAGSDELCLIKYDASGENCMSSAISPTVVDLTDSLAVESATLTEEAVSRPILDVGDSVEVVTATLTDTMLCDNIGISDEIRMPGELFISAYPNPFNASVAISTPADAKVDIFDIHGKHIADFKGGNYIWHPQESVGSGIYLVRAALDDVETVERIIYLK